MDEVQKLGDIVDEWTKAKMGERVHIDRLLAYVPVVHFHQLEKDGPSFCDTPTMTFRCVAGELPYYTRIE